MAYFECIVGNGGGGSGIPLIVTCDSDFAGLTISATDGTTTLTAQCPSSSPYVVNFSLPNTGTWTVSGTISGTPYSAQITISEYTLSLVTGFNWEDWVDAGGLDHTDYSSLSDVFADEAAVRRLMLVHDSVDYLVDAVTADVDTLDDFVANDTAMKWLGLSDYATDNIVAITGAEAKLLASTYWERYLKDHVPTMTSDSAPYGEAIYSSYTSGYPAWKAFDGDDSTIFAVGTSESGSTSSTAYIGYTFTNPTKVNKFKIVSPTATTYVSKAKLVASNDGFVTQTVIADDIALVLGENVVSVTNNNYYLSYRLYLKEASGSGSTIRMHNADIATLQFYGRQLSVSVPVMASNTAPYGTVTYNSQLSTDPLYAAFSSAGGLSAANDADA